jgi:hypothetical protein
MNKLTRMLLATTCLTALASAPAAALTVNEVETNDSLATANVLPLGTTEVLALAEVPFSDFFKLSGLEPGETFTATIDRLSDPITGGFFFNSQFTANASGGALIDSEPVGNGPQIATVTGAIPADGMLVFSSIGNISEGGPMGYHITITAPLAVAVPQPHAFALLGAGVAGLAGLTALVRRKRD